MVSKGANLNNVFIYKFDFDQTRTLVINLENK